MSPLHMDSPPLGKNTVPARFALRALDHPEHMSHVDLLVREVIQNAVDAKFGDVGVQVRFELFRPGPALSAAWRSMLGADGLADWIRGRIKYEDWILLRIVDSGTTGLNGPVDASAAVEAGTTPRFQRLAYRFGIPQDSPTGGGAWGLGGKTIVFRMSPDLGLVAYYSRPAEREPSRMICIHCHAHDEAETRIRDRCPTGFAWWGATDEDGRSAKAVISEEAEAHAQALGFETSDPGWRGTQILVPLTRAALTSFLAGDEVGRSSARWTGETIGKYAEALVSSIRRWWWPRLAARVSQNGERLPSDLNVVVKSRGDDPSWNGGSVDTDCDAVYKAFKGLFAHTFSGSRGARKTRPLSIQNYGGHMLGFLSEELFPSDSSVARLLEAGERERMGAKPNLWITALMRDVGMVVSYHHDGCVDAPSDHVGLAVARVNGCKKLEIPLEDESTGPRRMTLEEVFRSAENPSHSEWRAKLLEDQTASIGKWPRTYVKRFFAAVREALEPADGDDGGEMSDGEIEPLTLASNLLARTLLPAGEGTRPDGRPGRTPSQHARASGRETIPKVELADIRRVDSAGEDAREALLMARDIGDPVSVRICLVDESGQLIDAEAWSLNSDEPYPVTMLCGLQPADAITIREDGESRCLCRISGDWMLVAVIVSQEGTAPE